MCWYQDMYQSIQPGLNRGRSGSRYCGRKRQRTAVLYKRSWIRGRQAVVAAVGSRGSCCGACRREQKRRVVVAAAVAVVVAAAGRRSVACES